jgi:hypothetical protein
VTTAPGDPAVPSVTGIAPRPSPWDFATVNVHRGGPVLVRRPHAPLGQSLPYRRHAGDHPPVDDHTEQRVARIRAHGWTVHLPAGSLGDTLLGLATAAGLAAAAPEQPIHYSGPRPDLLLRSTLPLASATATRGPHVLSTDRDRDGAAPRFAVTPELPPTWLEPVNEHLVRVHADLPMRYYLALEQELGVRLPAEHTPAPTYRSDTAAATVGRVVFVGATSRPNRKDVGTDGFAALARRLTARRGDLSFRMLDAPDTGTREHELWTNLGAPAAADCVDVFADAELVIGNDTGLTHLAALTRRADGTGPTVLGLASRHAHTKWTTGNFNHTTVGTRFSAMLSAADRCPVRDDLDDTLWGSASAITGLPTDQVAAVAGHAAGWW